MSSEPSYPDANKGTETRGPGWQASAREAAEKHPLFTTEKPADWDERHGGRMELHSPDHIEQFFYYSHLPSPLQAISKPFCELAAWIVQHIPRNPERTVALRKLLEAKDAAVRAALAKSHEIDRQDGLGPVPTQPYCADCDSPCEFGECDPPHLCRKHAACARCNP